DDTLCRGRIGTEEVDMGTEIPNQQDGIADARPAAHANVADDRTAAEAEIEKLIETDPSLVPSGPSQFIVSARLLEDEELAALLEGLAPLLDGVSSLSGGDPFVVKEREAVDPNSEAQPLSDASSEEDHEPHTTPVGCGRRHPELSPLAWLFPNHAGA